jgi:phosphoglycerate dehydrogenase-like enzyme
MSGLRAAYLLDPEPYDLVYGPEQRRAVRRLVVEEPPVLTAADVAAGTGALADVDVLLTGWGVPPLDAHVLAQAPRLRAVLHGAGAVRGFVTDALLARGLVVSSASSANAVPVVQYSVAAVHLSLKRVWQLLQAPTADAARTIVPDVPGAYDAAVGLLGLGEIGRRVCRRLAADDGLRLLACDPWCSPDEARALGVELVGLDELFARSEVVSLHAPLHEGTAGLVGAEQLRALPTGATLINTARGGVVRTDDLLAVLRERSDLQAVLDVTDPEPLPQDHPLRSLPNVVLTPHVAGSRGRECRRMGALVVRELAALAAGRPLQHAVDLSRLERAATP